MPETQTSADAPVVAAAERAPKRRRSLVTDILTLQLAITGAVAAIALAGLTWTSGSVVRDDLGSWAQLWASELNDLGAPFYLRNVDEAVLDVERFVAKYPEIERVVWYRPDGTVLDSLEKRDPANAARAPLPPDTVSELAAQAGNGPAYMAREDLEGDHRFRLSGPIWVESFTGDGLFGLQPDDDAETAVELLGFVAVDLDFSAYQGTFNSRLVMASLALLLLLCASWIGGRVLLKRALRPLSELQQPLVEIAQGKTEVEFPVSRHSETQAMVTALSDTLQALDKREQHLLHLANHDPLTGLYSRHRLTAELETSSVSEDGGGWTALCFVDLDQFKYVNDTCGHPAGDQVLKLAAEQLRHAVRGDDFVARFGGDEFIVLLRNVSRPQASDIANRILTQMRSFSYIEQEHVFQLQCSIGIASVNFSRFSPHELIAQADMACHTAKTLGRNRVEYYKLSGKQAERMVQDVRWLRIMRDALESDDFVLHYQPLMHIGSGTISQFEALLRLKTHRGLVRPQSFLPAAIRFGLMADIDRWVVEHAVRALAELDSSQSHLRLSINLSSFALEQESFAAEVQNLLKEYSVSGDRIVFEITEQMAVRFAVETDKQIGMLRDVGCGIAIDDFGTGYSSFSYLKRLPVDYLKIDGSFITGLVDDAVDQSMVRMVGDVARAAGIQTVAEYVQSEAVLRMLAEFRIDYAQGFYIGRPAPKLQAVDVPSPIAHRPGPLRSLGPALAADSL